MIRSVLSWLFTCAIASIYTLSWAQQTAKIPVVGVLVTHAPLTDPVFTSIRAGLRQFGYEEGRNIKLEIVTAEGKLDRLPGLADDLVRRKVDIIFCPNEVSARTAMKASTTIPIVMIAFSGDPVASGLINSLSRPGGNVTGIYSLSADLEPKRLEILKDLLPRNSKVTVFWDPAFGSQLPAVRAAAQALGMTVESVEVRSAQDLEKAFKGARQKKVGSALLMTSPIFYVNRERVGPLALEARLAAIGAGSQLVSDGLLLSYGNDVDEIYRRAGYYVDRLLKGSKPADLPVEQVTKLSFTVNLKTAKALGITFPESIMVRADKVIK